MTADPMDLAGFAGAFTFSFLASLHCAAMCAPLVCAKLGIRSSVFRSSLWLYNAGRFVSYTTAGLFAGGIGKQVSKISVIAGPLAATIGVAMIVYGLMRILRGGQTALPDLLVRLLNKTGDLGLGLLTVLLPCATLTPALIAAAASGEPVRGALIMAGFFAGTLPVMLLAPAFPGMLANQLGGKLPRTLARLAGPAFLIFAGAITLARVLH